MDQSQPPSSPPVSTKRTGTWPLVVGVIALLVLVVGVGAVVLLPGLLGRDPAPQAGPGATASSSGMQTPAKPGTSGLWGSKGVRQVWESRSDGWGGPVDELVGGLPGSNTTTGWSVRGAVELQMQHWVLDPATGTFIAELWGGCAAEPLPDGLVPCSGFADEEESQEPYVELRDWGTGRTVWRTSVEMPEGTVGASSRVTSVVDGAIVAEFWAAIAQPHTDEGQSLEVVVKLDAQGQVLWTTTHQCVVERDELPVVDSKAAVQGGVYAANSGVVVDFITGEPLFDPTFCATWLSEDHLVVRGHGLPESVRGFEVRNLTARIDIQDALPPVTVMTDDAGRRLLLEEWGTTIPAEAIDWMTTTVWTVGDRLIVFDGVVTRVFDVSSHEELWKLEYAGDGVYPEGQVNVDAELRLVLVEGSDPAPDRSDEVVTTARAMDTGDALWVVPGKAWFVPMPDGSRRLLAVDRLPEGDAAQMVVRAYEAVA